MLNIMKNELDLMTGNVNLFLWLFEKKLKVINRKIYIEKSLEDNGFKMSDIVIKKL